MSTLGNREDVAPTGIIHTGKLYTLFCKKADGTRK